MIHPRLWPIDFPKAVDLINNPYGFDMPHHDVVTMCTWFARRGVDGDGDGDGDAIFAELLAEAF